MSAEASLVRELACDLSVFALKGLTLLECGGALMQREERGSIVAAPQLATGLRLQAPGLAPPRLVAVAGRWPDAAWAATGEMAGNGNSTELRFYRWQTNRWARWGKSVELGGPMSWVVFPWKEDGLAALAPSPFGPTRALVLAPRPGALPALTEAVQSAAERESYACQHAMLAPEAWVELSPGDVMVFSGQLCGVGGGDSGSHSLGLERLRAGQKLGELSVLPVPNDLPPDVSWNVVGAAALGPSDALVAAHDSAGRSYLAHWDGESWQRETPPFEALNGLWALAGVFWAVDDQGESWTRRGERFIPVAWASSTPRELVAPSRSAAITQVLTVGAVTWLVQREERGAEVTSRLYEVRLQE